MSTFGAQPEPKEESMSFPPNFEVINYLYGHPLVGTLSPLLHQTIYNALGINWAQIPLSKPAPSAKDGAPLYTVSPPIETFLRSIRAEPKCIGASVTMPWKVKIMSHLDELSDAAVLCGAVNTVIVRNEPSTLNGGEVRQTLFGTNTDCIGMRESLLRNHPEHVDSGVFNPYQDKPALIVGGGGTARAAIYTLQTWLGVSKIYIVNRDASEIADIVATNNSKRRDGRTGTIVDIIPLTDVAQVLQSDFEPPMAIISGIPDYMPSTPEEVRTREVVTAILQRPSGRQDPGVFLEMCYHPRPYTTLAGIASQAGWKLILGTESMIYQGLEQVRLFTGSEVAADPKIVASVKKVIDEAVEERLQTGVARN